MFRGGVYRTSKNIPTALPLYLKAAFHTVHTARAKACYNGSFENTPKESGENTPITFGT
ncbi:MAG: hypothetical protein ACLR56_14010 [Oscillospiraceae bacterium]